MQSFKNIWRGILQRAIQRETKAAVDLDSIAVETPPRPELGDLAVPLFALAKVFKRPPQEIASRIVRRINEDERETDQAGRAEALGPYINIRLDRPKASREVLQAVLQEGSGFGCHRLLHNQRITIEFSSPNTNKPLHLGHLRNNALGISLARILAAGGAKVHKVNLINNRGIHICKSMLAYQKFGAGSTPETEKIKGDHLVGDYYVRFNRWAAEHPEAEEEARRMLKLWEQGDPQLNELWERMNRWAIGGIEETYQNTGVSFDRIYYESETYLLGREEVFRGLEKGIFKQEADGSVWVDLIKWDLDRKVLLRSDGTSLYLTQDLGTALLRYKDWAFDRMIYVVANEQEYHFKVLFKVLELLGYNWSKQLHHLAYGMVNLPEGKMKSREGTVVDADDLLAELENLVAKEIRDKERETEIEDLEGTCRKIALAALNYYLLQTSPYKDMIFNPQESISFSGNTGPYLQYTGARISSMLRKFDSRRDQFEKGVLRPELLTVQEEWQIVKLLASYPETVETAAEQLNPSLITSHLYELAKNFARYYHDHPVLHNPEADLVVTRITLAKAVLQVLKNGCPLIGVPLLEKM